MKEGSSSEPDQENPEWKMRELDELGKKWGIGPFSNPIVSLEGLSAETRDPISSLPNVDEIYFSDKIIRQSAGVVEGGFGSVATEPNVLPPTDDPNSGTEMSWPTVHEILAEQERKRREKLDALLEFLGGRDKPVSSDPRTDIQNPIEIQNTIPNRIIDNKPQEIIQNKFSDLGVLFESQDNPAKPRSTQDPDTTQLSEKTLKLLADFQQLQELRKKLKDMGDLTND